MIELKNMKTMAHYNNFGYFYLPTSFSNVLSTSITYKNMTSVLRKCRMFRHKTKILRLSGMEATKRHVLQTIEVIMAWGGGYLK